MKLPIPMSYCRLLGILLFVAVPTASPASLDGRVVGVHDGDTITVLDSSKKQHKIRLAAIDAPELKQAFGTRSRQNLAALVFEKDVAVEWEKPDRYKRIVGKVLLSESGADCAFRDCRKSLDAGLQQIRDGMAWHYKQYEREQSPEDRGRYATADRDARAAKRELWADPQPVPPWEWRRAGRARALSGAYLPSSPIR